MLASPLPVDWWEGSVPTPSSRTRRCRSSRTDTSISAWLTWAWRAGASAYVLKQIRGQDLVEAISAVAQGRSLIDPATTARLMDLLRGNVAEDAELGQLTQRERQILELISARKTNREIGAELYLAEKTVKNYVSNPLAKLGMARRSEAAAYAARLEERRAQRSSRGL
jgi:DNA-binding NarL/FixJ family response regulator